MHHGGGFLQQSFGVTVSSHCTLKGPAWVGVWIGMVLAGLLCVPGSYAVPVSFTVVGPGAGGSADGTPLTGALLLEPVAIEDEPAAPIETERSLEVPGTLVLDLSPVGGDGSQWRVRAGRSHPSTGRGLDRFGSGLRHHPGRPLQR